MRFQQSCQAGTRERSGILARQVWPVRPPAGCNRPSPFISSVVVSLLCLCMLSAPGARSARPWTGDEYNEHIGEKYLEADLVIMGDIVSFVPRTIGESDSVAPDGWTYHRTTNVIVCDAAVDSVLKGNYGDSMITFQSMPYAERSRSRLVRPSDSLHVMEIAEPVGGEEVPGRILQRGQHLLFLKSQDGTLICIYHAQPGSSALAVLRKVSTEEKAQASEPKIRMSRNLPEPRDWAAVPEIEPIWVLKVDGDSVFVLRNGFVTDQGQAIPGKGFPVELVPIRVSRWGRKDDGSQVHTFTRTFLRINRDGTASSDRIRWEVPDDIRGDGNVVGRSFIGEIAVFSKDGGTVLRGPGSALISSIPYETKSAQCFDVARRIVAVMAQRFTVSGERLSLWKILLLDYGGNILYEGRWTECRPDRPWVSWRGDVFGFGLAGCSKPREHVWRVDEGVLYSLEGVPDGFRYFSPDGRHVLHCSPQQMSLFELSSSKPARALWERHSAERLREAALSNSLELVCYGLGHRRPVYSHLYIFSAKDGQPSAKLVPAEGAELVGPFSFVHRYLFTATIFGIAGRPANTKYICVFDLSSLTPVH